MKGLLNWLRAISSAFFLCRLIIYAALSCYPSVDFSRILFNQYISHIFKDPHNVAVQLSRLSMLAVININNLKSLTARDGVKKDNLQQEVGHLKAEVSHLQSGMDSMEQNIRDRLRLVTNRVHELICKAISRTLIMIPKALRLLGQPIKISNVAT
jgi:hypothetical protein